MPGPLFDPTVRPLYEPLRSQLAAEMKAAGEVTDFRPWMTRAAEIYRELRDKHEAGCTEE